MGADAKSLLEEAGWVRRLAHTLARDGEADDLAQDAMVTALDKQPEARESLRGWLAEVMRRLVHTRCFARRIDRERAIESNPPEGADGLVEKAELLRMLASVVGELEEPSRSTVLLRYYEGLTSAQIARRQGVPAGTVRWRLKQALEQLRDRLDRRVDGGRRAWCLMFGPSPVVGGLALLKVAAVIVAVSAAGAVGWRSHRESSSTEGRVPGPVIAARVAPAPARAVAPAVQRALDDEPPPKGNELERAKDAYVRGRYAEAVELSRRGIAQDGEKAWRVLGAASCFLGDANGATGAWNHLDPTGKKFLEYVCQRNHVTIPIAVDATKLL